MIILIIKGSILQLKQNENINKIFHPVRCYIDINIM